MTTQKTILNSKPQHIKAPFLAPVPPIHSSNSPILSAPKLNLPNKNHPQTHQFIKYEELNFLIRTELQ